MSYSNTRKVTGSSKIKKLSQKNTSVSMEIWNKKGINTPKASMRVRELRHIEHKQLSILKHYDVGRKVKRVFDINKHPDSYIKAKFGKK
jgi:hypothetical protein